MASAQDPFYIVKEEIQDSIEKLESTFHKWQRIPSDTGDQVNLTKELLASFESIEWQVDELDKTIAVAAKDPAWYGINEVELESRRRWTSGARTQVGTMKKVVAGKESSAKGTSSVNGMRQELMRMPNYNQTDRSNQYGSQDNDDFISSESDRQLLLIKFIEESFPRVALARFACIPDAMVGDLFRVMGTFMQREAHLSRLAQDWEDEELDELSASVERIGGVGLTIHEELLAQEKIIDDLGTEMESTTNRLDFVQKKVAMVMKKASAKGQLMMILFLVVLFIVLFVLVFFT